jgi:hypothetical protein
MLTIVSNLGLKLRLCETTAFSNTPSRRDAEKYLYLRVILNTSSVEELIFYGMSSTGLNSRS